MEAADAEHKTKKLLKGAPRRLMISVASKIPVDMVFSYVDGNNPEHVKQRSRYRATLSSKALSENVSDAGDVDIRFRNVGEIAFSVNSVLKYLPWIRNIFIVTDTPRPPVSPYLLDSGRVRVVDQRELIPPQYLPTFNSIVIESFLHRIDGLSEIFLYNNDDYMHFSPIRPDFFYTTNEEGRSSLELHAYPALYRRVLHRFSHMYQGYRTNLHTAGISNAYTYLTQSWPHLARHEVLVPVHATMLWRRSTALRIEEEFGAILEKTRRMRFRDAENLSYYTILYSMEKKWNPQDRMHLHILGNLFAPNAMFDFTAFSVFGNKGLLWKRIARSKSRLACLNNVPPSERERFVEAMMKKGLGDPAPESVSILSRMG
jgi:hypothetical protein